MTDAKLCEVMARNHTELIRDRDRYERFYRQERSVREGLGRSNAALRGAITRLKREHAEEVKLLRAALAVARKAKEAKRER